MPTVFIALSFSCISDGLPWRFQSSPTGWQVAMRRHFLVLISWWNFGVCLSNDYGWQILWWVTLEASILLHFSWNSTLFRIFNKQGMLPQSLDYTKMNVLFCITHYLVPNLSCFVGAPNGLNNCRRIPDHAQESQSTNGGADASVEPQVSIGYSTKCEEKGAVCR